MMILIHSTIFVLLFIGSVYIVDWFWDVGVQEILVYTEHFLLDEARKVQVKVIPPVRSKKLWDRLELALYYSGIRRFIPFCSGKVWLIFCLLIFTLTFWIGLLCTGSILRALLYCGIICFLMAQFLAFLRKHNLRTTEKYLLEFINVTESFAVTGEDAVAILANCRIYIKGPIGQALCLMDSYAKKGWSGRMILAQIKVTLEHPKWQEFIHNLNVCSMYNSEYTYVFRSSRKSIQCYLTNKKERQSIKQTAKMEMSILVVLSVIIIAMMGKFLMISISDLIWGSMISRVCTIYMVFIVLLFYLRIGGYEKE